MMKETSDWSNVSYYLYSAISQEIELLQNHLSLVSKEKIKDLEDVINIYKENCVIGSDYLKEMINKLIENINDENG